MTAPVCSLVLVGDELLAGLVRDVNFEFLTKRLPSFGLAVRRAAFMGDDREPLAREIGTALAEGAVVIVAGGLGPTSDDVTRDAASDALGRPLVHSSAAWAAVEGFYGGLSRAVPSGAKREALVPQGAQILDNPVGAAPGVMVETAPGGLLVLLPGVPAELRAVFEGGVAPLLAERFGQACRADLLRTCGMREADLEQQVAAVRDRHPSVRFSFLPNHYLVDIAVTGEGSAEVVRVLERQLGWHVVGRGRPSLGEIVGGLLVEHQFTVAGAESLTGGLVGDMITDVPGSSRYLWGAVTAYSNDAKVRLLSVSEEALRKHGAVSREVAAQMSKALVEFGVSHGVSLTGIAGPAGGSDEKPVGLVYIGLAAPDGVWVYSFQWGGDRRTIKEYSAAASLNALRLHLLGAPHEASLMGAANAWRMS